MKKIFLFLAAACAITACESVQEDISNDGHISAAQLREMTTVKTDLSSDGKNGNVISCETFAPVNAKWTIAGKEYLGNYSTKKMKVGDHKVYLDALCADGTLLKDSFDVSCQVITNPLEKFWIYGEDPEAQPAFSPGAWDAAQMRFSDNEGKHLPYLSDDIYWGFKTLIFDVTEATDDCTAMVHNGWWSATYYDNVPVTNGAWELQITEDIAKDCARGNGGSGKDLQVLIKSGSCVINSVYYEE